MSVQCRWCDAWVLPQDHDFAACEREHRPCSFSTLNVCLLEHGHAGPHVTDADHLARRRDEPAERYFIGGDNSGHKYVVPVSRRAEWVAWLEIPEDDERSWEEPDYAKRIDGRLTFTDPRYGD